MKSPVLLDMTLSAPCVLTIRHGYLELHLMAIVLKALCKRKSHTLLRGWEVAPPTR